MCRDSSQSEARQDRPAEEAAHVLPGPLAQARPAPGTERQLAQMGPRRFVTAQGLGQRGSLPFHTLPSHSGVL